MSSKTEHILNCAMSILVESGDQGLTMRKIAERADMRLSNVQYYFKTKELLLAALLEGFLLEYADSMHLLSFPMNFEPQKRLSLLAFHILNDIESSNCSVIFKEIWAISERNSSVKSAVEQYYKQLYSMLFEALKQVAPMDCEDKQLDNTVVILLPFIEGYCITSSNLNISTKELADQLGSMMYNILTKSPN
ncbi:TetR/AcrR family transcriptional regulator [Thalassotalea sp. 1_MG-2023]|uniref:TetR/AcrR family transcriptional regulator n=1 Tax=Thalassotalea sp. 1_MG-2023 TaxID=3062680 RepID=UPI0026E19C44|nr:TetR/AcrR family transcriptional regulator [Thalassotalea sp. 1_MG-2023]MDO6428128.1 TetR/AcrR family transcriptional regulator [Thalassotalea sp. 1_MG-2023]